MWHVDCGLLYVDQGMWMWRGSIPYVDYIVNT